MFDGLLTSCGVCGHVWAEVDDAALPSLYSHEYFHGVEYGDYLADRPALERNFAARLHTLDRFLQPGHRRLLEVGCAYGVFLEQASHRFETATGIDISDDAVAHARSRGLDARQGDLVAADWRDERFDVVCAWDTVEHLGRPDRYVRAAADLMTGGGLLALTTGDIGSLNARWRGRHWRLIHPPTHVHYFSVETMRRLLDRNGFDLVHVEHPGVYRSIGNMLHNVAGRWGLHRAGEWAARSALGRSQMYLNLFDVMFVIARKRTA